GCGSLSGEPELTEFDLEVKPQGKDAPLSVTAQLGVTNDGGAEGTATLYVDDDSREEIVVPAGETVETSIELTVHYGTHTVAFGPQTASVDADGLTFEHPPSVQVDERFGLTVKGLPASDELTLHLSSASYEEERWANEVQLDVSDHQAELGPEEMMRLIQLMAPVSDEANGVFFPPIEGVGEAWQLRMAVRRAGTTLDETAVQRQWGDPKVSASDVEADGVVGTLYEPPGEGPWPAVVLLHGSGGRPARWTAGMLASRGFLALALHYFGEPRSIPDELVRVPIESVKRAGEWLRQHERAAGDQVGLWGSSKGAELALLAGSHFDLVGAVVSVSGSGVVWQGVSRRTRGSSWTYQGDPVPYVPYNRGSPTSLYDPSHVTDEELAEATIRVERIDGPVLLISGRDDGFWDSVELSEIALERLAQHDHPDKFRHLVYDEAGHWFPIPYLTIGTQASLDNDPAELRGLNFGGTREGVAEASADHWPKALGFLRSALTEDASTEASR
ncbi:MAG: acyl-CoA thioester hydrolase/BAAT C-terminal domain-containing protein, partial [Candidatus Bipolaricaulia bacterium]